MINNAVLVLGIQQRDSVIYVSILFQILFPGSLSQNIEQSSLCSTVGPCCLFSKGHCVHVNPILPISLSLLPSHVVGGNAMEYSHNGE